MSNITTYPGIPVVAGDDLMIISDMSTKGNPTKSVSITQLGNFIGASGGGAGVATFNGLSGAVTLIGGTGIDLATVGNNITINATASGGGTVTTVSTTVTGSTSMLATVTNATTTPNIAFTYRGTAAQYINGEGNLTDLTTLPVNLAPLATSRTSGQAIWNPATRILDIPNYSGDITQITNNGSDGDATLNAATKILNIPNYNNVFTDLFFYIAVPASGIPALAIYRNTTGATFTLSYNAGTPGDYIIESNIDVFTTTKRWHFTIMNPNIIPPISGTGNMPMPTIGVKKAGSLRRFGISTFNNGTGTVAGGKADIPTSGEPVSVELKFFPIAV